jgi:hypothetical protein
VRSDFPKSDAQQRDALIENIAEALWDVVQTVNWGKSGPACRKAATLLVDSFALIGEKIDD